VIEVRRRSSPSQRVRRSGPRASAKLTNVTDRSLQCFVILRALDPLLLELDVATKIEIRSSHGHPENVAENPGDGASARVVAGESRRHLCLPTLSDVDREQRDSQR